jgi:hypothetical protein
VLPIRATAAGRESAGSFIHGFSVFSDQVAPQESLYDLTRDLPAVKGRPSGF